VGLERGPISTTEELLGRKSSGSVLENGDDEDSGAAALITQKFALTSTSGGRSSSLGDSGHGVVFVFCLMGREAGRLGGVRWIRETNSHMDSILVFSYVKKMLEKELQSIQDKLVLSLHSAQFIIYKSSLSKATNKLESRRLKG
jgi:hypothetical protein